MLKLGAFALVFQTITACGDNHSAPETQQELLSPAVLAKAQMTENHRRLTDNQSHDFYPFIKNGRIAWQRDIDGVHEVVVYDTATSTETVLTSDKAWHDWNATLDGEVVAWYGTGVQDGSINEIFVQTPQKGRVQVTHAGSAEGMGHGFFDPIVSGQKVVWYGSDGTKGAEIYQLDLADGKLTQITDNDSPDITPVIFGDTIVWCGFDGSDQEIYFQRGGGNVRQITDNDTMDLNPAIDGDYIVWQGRDRVDGDFEIFLYEIGTGRIMQLTANEELDMDPSISGTHVAWSGKQGGDYEIFLYDLATQTLEQVTTNDQDDFHAAIHGNLLAWDSSPDEADSEIFTATISAK